MLPSWLQRRVHSLRRTGKLSFINETDVDPSALRQLGNEIFFIKTLDFSKTKIETLDGMPRLTKVTSFIADQSNLSDFRNFISLSSATSISIKKTPISKIPHYKLNILLASGPNLVKIDGQVITSTLRARYEQYPSACCQLVNAGWIATYPCPPHDKLIEICNQYNIPPPEEVPETSFQEDEEEVVIDPSDFDKLASKLKAKHEVLLQRKQALFGIIEEDNFDGLSDEDDFNERVVSLFNAHSMKLDPQDENQILEAIDDLCHRASQQNIEIAIPTPSDSELM